jgi:hypothetical protein
MSDFVDVKTGSQLTGYSQGYLRILAKRGTIEAIKVGNAWALDKASLMAFANKQRQTDGRYGPRSNQQ